MVITHLVLSIVLFVCLILPCFCLFFIFFFLSFASYFQSLRLSDYSFCVCVFYHSRPWDISRQTSFTSLDFEDDVIRYFGSTESPEYIPELAEDFRQRDDVLASPLMFPKQWSTLDDDYDVADSDDSYSK